MDWTIFWTNFLDHFKGGEHTISTEGLLLRREERKVVVIVNTTG